MLADDQFLFWKNKNNFSDAEEAEAKSHAWNELDLFCKGQRPTQAWAAKLYDKVRSGEKVNIILVSVDSENETRSFAGPMKELHRFLPASREAFLSDALKHLTHLNPLDEDDRKSAYSLCYALIEAKKKAGGSLGHPHDDNLKAIMDDEYSPAGKILRNAEDKSSSRQNQAGVLHYQPRDRGQSGGFSI